MFCREILDVLEISIAGYECKQLKKWLSSSNNGLSLSASFIKPICDVKARNFRKCCPDGNKALFCYIIMTALCLTDS